MSFDPPSYALGKSAGNGGGGGTSGVMVITENTDTGALSATWSAIRDALGAGKIVVISNPDVTTNMQSVICQTMQDNEATHFTVYINFDYQNAVYEADDAAGYPVAIED